MLLFRKTVDSISPGTRVSSSTRNAVPAALPNSRSLFISAYYLHLLSPPLIHLICLFHITSLLSMHHILTVPSFPQFVTRGGRQKGSHRQKEHIPGIPSHLSNSFGGKQTYPVDENICELSCRAQGADNILEEDVDESIDRKSVV